MKTRIRIAVLCVVLIAAGAMAAWGAQVEELPTLGGSTARAYDVNEDGQVVGCSTRVGYTAIEATVWTAGVPEGLGVAAGTNFSCANAINIHGEAVGYSETGVAPGQPGNLRTATFWDAGGPFDIGASLALNFSTANDINDGGVAALQGDSPNPFGSTAGWAWSMALGGTPAGGDSIYRLGANHGINNSNDLAGYAAAGFDGAQAIYTRFNGKGWDIGIEIGPQGVRAPARANAISDSGIVVGQAGDGRQRSSQAARFTLDPHRPVAWLDTLEGFDFADALDVNDGALIVGEMFRFTAAGLESRAVAWIDGRAIDLNRFLNPTSSFAILVSATGVNNRGDIVGCGLLHNGDERAFVIYGFRPNP
jgi:uncharacterized membrane protein